MRFRMPWEDIFIQAILRAFKGKILDIKAEKESKKKPKAEEGDDNPPW